MLDNADPPPADPGDAPRHVSELFSRAGQLADQIHRCVERLDLQYRQLTQMRATQHLIPDTRAQIALAVNNTREALRRGTAAIRAADTLRHAVNMQASRTLAAPRRAQAYLNNAAGGLMLRQNVLELTHIADELLQPHSPLIASNQDLIDSLQSDQNRNLNRPQQPFRFDETLESINRIAAWSPPGSQGVPARTVYSAAGAARQSRAEQAWLYANGAPVNGHSHRRRYDFLDGGYVEIQAHRPEPTHSGSSNALVAAAFFLGFIGVALASFGFGAGLGIAAGIGVMTGWETFLAAVTGGAVAAIGTATGRPRDAARQDYTIRFYRPSDGDTPWRVERFAGTTQSSSALRQVSINNEYHPALYADFADNPGAFDWADSWRTSQTDLRADPPPPADADLLVDELPLFTAPVQVLQLPPRDPPPAPPRLQAVQPLPPPPPELLHPHVLAPGGGYAQPAPIMNMHLGAAALPPPYNGAGGLPPPYGGPGGAGGPLA